MLTDKPLHLSLSDLKSDQEVFSFYFGLPRPHELIVNQLEIQSGLVYPNLVGSATPLSGKS